MGEGEPLGELSRGLVGGRPVKRHHRGRNARHAQQLGAPTVADEHHLNEVRAPADSLFESVKGHGAIFGSKGDGSRSYASAAADQAKRDAKAGSTPSRTRRIELSFGKNFYGSSFSTAFARVIHIFSTTRALRGILRADREVTMRHRSGYL